MAALIDDNTQGACQDLTGGRDAIRGCAAEKPASQHKRTARAVGVIGALASCLSLITPGAAQTPVPIAAANDLRVCILSAQGFRDAPRLAQLDLSLEQIREKNWGSLTEIAPGIFRMARNGTDRSIEIKLPDATGAAHCMAFGPSLGPGQGALTADKFVELNFLQGLVPAATPQGVTRRYNIPKAPYQADLIAYSTASGDVVGFAFSGVPETLTTRTLSAADPSVTYRSVSTALTHAVEICLRNYLQRDTVDAALSAYGFEFGFETGGSLPSKVHFTPDNAVLILLGPGTCMIETNYMNPSATVNITAEALNRAAPGGFTQRVENHNGCTRFFAEPTLNLPLSLTVLNARNKGSGTCNEDGTSRIAFVVAG